MRLGVTNFQPKRLTEARESFGMTKVALADMLDITTATISKWESGGQLPEEKLLSRLSEKLNFPTHFFMKKEQESLVEKPYFYRSNSSATKKARAISKIKIKWASEISDVVQEWVDFPKVTLPRLDEKDFLNISDNEIEDISLECRKIMGLGTAPIPDVIMAMESAGVIAIRDELGIAKMDGVSNWKNDRPYVFISSDKANGIRNRFDAAHECSHLILHSNVSETDYKKYYKEIERQANLFAGRFLMPSATFAEDIVLPTLDGLLSLKKRWKTSLASMIYRCWELDIINDDQKMRLYKGKSARGWTTREPYDDMPAERPRLLHRSIKMIVDNNLISKESLMDEIALPATLLDRICNTDSYFSKRHEEELVTLKVATNNKIKNSKGETAKVVSIKQRT